MADEINKIGTTLHSWKNNERLNARDYVHERNTITQTLDDVIDEQVNQDGLLTGLRTDVDTNIANIASNDTDIANLQTGKLNRDGTQAMTGNLNMDTFNITTEGSINATTFENGDNASDAVVFNNFVSLFDLDTLIAEELEKQPNENYLQYYTRLLELKFSDIQSAEELALTFLRRSGVDPMTGDLDLDGNAITNVGDIADLETEIGNKVPNTRTVAGLDLIDDITVEEIKTAIGEATTSVAGLMSAADKTSLDALVELLGTDDVDTVVNTLGEIIQIFSNYQEGTTLVDALAGKVDKITGYGLSQNDFTDALKTKLDSLNAAAEENVQSDWNEEDTNSDAFIKNKPEVYTQTELNEGQLDTRYYTESETDAFLAGKVDVGTLSSTLTLYPTTTYEVGGDFDDYAQMVSTTSDARYNDTAVILYTTDDRTETGTSSITSTDLGSPSLVGQLIADPGLFTGDISGINTTTIGEVIHAGGNRDAYIRYKIYNSSDMVNEIAQSEYVLVSDNNTTFFETFQNATIANASFDINDRIVIHYEAYREGGGQAPIIGIRFGGENPTRSLLPVPLSVVTNAQLIKYDNTTSGLDATNLQEAIDEVKSDIPTNNNQLTNGAGYITGYTVTEGDVTQHEEALTIAQSQVTNLTTDLGNKADLVNGKIPVNQIPLQFDDVLQGYYNLSDGEFYQEDTFENLIEGANVEGKLYIDIASNSIYRFEGSAYAPVITVDEIVYGTVGGTAYEGNNGQANADAISALQTSVGTNTTNIGTNATNITTNATAISNIEDGTTVVAKANADADGNDIVDTYATKTELSNATIDTLEEIGDVTAGATGGQFLQRNVGDTAWEGATISKTTVGLENVQNYGIATQAEAEAGLLDNEYMTPLKTAQAISALAPEPDLSTVGQRGAFSTAIGFGIFLDDINGEYNTAFGYEVLRNNLIGRQNTAAGYRALFENTTGNANTANGVDALRDNTSGSNNTANGLEALRDNTTGNQNTANGLQALRSNTTGDLNTAIGLSSLYSNSSGSSNTVSGANALSSNTTGSNNTANGRDAGRRIVNGSSNQTGSNSTFIGYDTRANANGQTNQTVIGYTAIGKGSNTVQLGNSSVSQAWVGDDPIVKSATTNHTMIWTGTQAEYDALGTYDNDTLYFITG